MNGPYLLLRSTSGRLHLGQSRPTGLALGLGLRLLFDLLLRLCLAWSLLCVTWILGAELVAVSAWVTLNLPAMPTGKPWQNTDGISCAGRPAGGPSSTLTN